MNTKNYKIITDTDNWLYKLPPFIKRMFFKIYLRCAFVYLEEGDKPTYCSDKLRWLDDTQIYTCSLKRADKLAFEYYNKTYPQYNKYIQLW